MTTNNTTTQAPGNGGDVSQPDLNQQDIDAGIHCESFRPEKDNFDADGCARNHPTCMGKYCPGYRPGMTDEALEPIAYRAKTRTNQYGELRLVEE